MIALMKRILAVSGAYKGRIQWAFLFSFLKSFFAKTPICLAFFAFSAFLGKTADGNLCLWIGVWMAVSVILQILCQNTADRLQSAAGVMIFADKRVELGAHLRKMPMGYLHDSSGGYDELYFFRGE